MPIVFQGWRCRMDAITRVVVLIVVVILSLVIYQMWHGG